MFFTIKGNVGCGFAINNLHMLRYVLFCSTLSRTCALKAYWILPKPFSSFIETITWFLSLKTFMWFIILMTYISWTTLQLNCGGWSWYVTVIPILVFHQRFSFVSSKYLSVGFCLFICFCILVFEVCVSVCFFFWFCY